jgi:hypothetical protein
MTGRALPIIGVLAFVAVGFAHGAEPAVPSTVITFDGDEPGRPPSGFTTAVTGGGGLGSWIVREDPGAPSGKKVLVQASAEKTSGRFPLCIYDAISAADLTLVVEFKPMSGTIDQAAGLVWRYQNPANYYLVRANALEGNVVLYKVENGKRSDLKPLGSGWLTYGKKATVERGRWQTLSVQVHGSRFRVALDGEHLFDVEDTTFRVPGKVGFWTKADSVTAFDDLKVQVTPP